MREHVKLPPGSFFIYVVTQKCHEVGSLHGYLYLTVTLQFFFLFQEKGPQMQKRLLRTKY